jgi:hypothetical protein
MHDATAPCRCQACQQESGDHSVGLWHQHMKLFLGRLDEQQRRWYVAMESLRHGHGGDVLLSRITGMNVETIRRGRRELQEGLHSLPAGRIRRAGAGRPPVKKRIPPSSRI